MTEPQSTALKAGDLINATVTKTMPFGALVEAPDGMPGLVQGLLSAVEGTRLVVRVDDVDAGKHRFSASVD